MHGYIIFTSSTLNDLFACLTSVSRAGGHKAFGYGLLNFRGRELTAEREVIVDANWL